jgi:hypothetical protein
MRLFKIHLEKILTSLKTVEGAGEENGKIPLERAAYSRKVCPFYISSQAWEVMFLLIFPVRLGRRPGVSWRSAL